MNETSVKTNFTGIGLAVLATLIWSGNFIVAKAVTGQIPPIALSFYRWLTASVIIFPFAYRAFRKEWPVVKQSIHFLFWISLTGISLFNSFVYIGAHYTSAINLALIGTTTSPILSVLFARIFLKEKVGLLKLLGLILCVCGVLFLLSKGNINNLLHLHFGTGDLWMLLAAFCFAVYNTMAGRKPKGLSPTNFLFVIFVMGTLFLLPFYLWEAGKYPPIVWNLKSGLSVLYLGLGASVICLRIWNMAIGKLGTGRTALFGNLIPIFSSIEAAILLHEDFTMVHVVSMAIVFAGIILANIKLNIRRPE